MTYGEDSKAGDRHSWESLSVSDRYRSSIGDSPTGEYAQRIDVMRPLRRRLIVTDLLMIICAIAIGLLLSSRASTWAIDPTVAIYGTPMAIGTLWLLFLGLRGSYDQRVIGLGTEEIRRVVTATLYVFAVVAGISYLFRADISRAYAFISLPLGLVLIITGRFAWRGWLYRQRRRGHFQHRTIVVGSGPAQRELLARLRQDAFAGYTVVGEWHAPEAETESLEAWLEGLNSRIAISNADAVAITPSATITTDAVRQIAWTLEGNQTDLLIAPAMLDIQGPRLSVRPAAGLPLLHLDEVALTRPQRIAKRALDLLLASILVVGLSPVLLACAIMVRASSRGPVFFRQVRIGRGGEQFTMLKFRTMVEGADAQREALRTSHSQADPLFKLTNDPRITRAGHFLRKWSLDELPQLLNVLGGSMSLVGPRPHPLDDVDRYELQAYRRLALKPGMTGLWQVEGRSDIPWEDALQLDLYYVESWTLSGDVVLLARTVRAVLQGRGAR